MSSALSSFSVSPSTYLDDMIEQLSVMRRQEQSRSYQKCDYFRLQEQQYQLMYPYQQKLQKQVQQQVQKTNTIPVTNQDLDNDTDESFEIDVTCRTIMIDWCYQVVDYCKLDRNRGVVEIAISYLDRFLSVNGGAAALHDRSTFQLAAMTCLYSAIKIHEPKAMSPELVSALSRGSYSPEQIVAMESIVLHSLSWNVNPPTTASYMHMYEQLYQTILREKQQQQQQQQQQQKLDEGVFHNVQQSHYFIDETLDDKMSHNHYHPNIIDTTRCQCELALTNYGVQISIHPSTIAYCAFRNSVLTVEKYHLSNSHISIETLQQLDQIVFPILFESCNSKGSMLCENSILDIQQILWHCYIEHRRQQNPELQSNITAMETNIMSRSRTVSISSSSSSSTSSSSSSSSHMKDDKVDKTIHNMELYQSRISPRCGSASV